MSALEGGYQISAEHSSAFAKSVKAHVATMCSSAAARAEAPYLQSDMDTEEQVEREVGFIESYLLLLGYIFFEYYSTCLISLCAVIANIYILITCGEWDVCTDD